LAKPLQPMLGWLVEQVISGHGSSSEGSASPQSIGSVAGCRASRRKARLVAAQALRSRYQQRIERLPEQFGVGLGQPYEGASQVDAPRRRVREGVEPGHERRELDPAGIRD